MSILILALKLSFRKSVTYVLGCSFIKSSLLRSILLYEVNWLTLNSMLDKLKKIKINTFKKTKGFKVKAEVYLKPNRIFMMKLFCENS